MTNRRKEQPMVNSPEAAGEHGLDSGGRIPRGVLSKRLIRNLQNKEFLVIRVLRFQHVHPVFIAGILFRIVL